MAITKEVITKEDGRKVIRITNQPATPVAIINEFERAVFENNIEKQRSIIAGLQSQIADAEAEILKQQENIDLLDSN